MIFSSPYYKLTSRLTYGCWSSTMFFLWKKVVAKESFLLQSYTTDTLKSDQWSQMTNSVNRSWYIMKRKMQSETIMWSQVHFPQKCILRYAKMQLNTRDLEYTSWMKKYIQAGHTSDWNHQIQDNVIMPTHILRMKKRYIHACYCVCGLPKNNMREIRAKTFYEVNRVSWSRE